MFKQEPADLDFFGFPIFFPPLRVLFLSSFQLHGASVVVGEGGPAVVGDGGPAVVGDGGPAVTVAQDTEDGVHCPSLPHLIQCHPSVKIRMCDTLGILTTA